MNKRFGSVSMMAATAAAILGFNTLSLHVSAERAKVDKLERQMAADMRDIRALEAELRTRGRLPVLQTWNDNVLALSAPTAKQFADSPVQLAAFAPGAAPAVPGAPAVQMALATQEASAVRTPGLVKASYEVPTAEPAGMVIEFAAAPVAKPVESAKAEPKKAEPAKVETAKVEPKKAESKKVETARAEPKRAEPKKVETAKAEPKKAEKKAEPVKLAMAKPKSAPKPAKADDGLDSLIGAIDSAAAAERGGLQKVSLR